MYSKLKIADLEKEFSSLQVEYVDLKSKFENFVKKYSNHETRYEKICEQSKFFQHVSFVMVF